MCKNVWFKPNARDIYIFIALCVFLSSAALIYCYETGPGLSYSSVFYCPAKKDSAPPVQAQQPRPASDDADIHVSVAAARRAAAQAVHRSLAKVSGVAVLLYIVYLLLFLRKGKKTSSLFMNTDGKDASKDPLTGLLDRSALYGAVSETIRLSPERCHAFFMMDLDNFKKINDTFGHLKGDTVLRSVAEHILSSVEKGDIVGRIGGDEFIVLTRDVTGRTAAESKAKALQKAVSGMEEVTVSIGIALYPYDGTAFEALYDHADIAMYRAKEKGRDRCEFYCGCR
ncbi:MAG: GGDEF domain-containing protein [Synergistaceae bacterium]|nr:GGDEF domain-containing protein [Synergistaceae bacterium]